jgi:tripartite-type tricarboxylate transporter receptor subunit TctC
MKTKWSCSVKCFLALSFLVALSSTAGSEQFYEGKTIRFIVGSQPGGGFDIMTRAIAQHISKHIPGNPSTIVDYMPGAGHLILVRHMYERAKPDGLTIANFIGHMILGQQLGLTKAGLGSQCRISGPVY